TLGSATNASSRIAAIWLDTAMSGTVSGESYVAWITTSTDMDAIFGIHSATGTGVATNLFYFDSSCEDQAPVFTGGFKCLLDSTTVYIPYFNNDGTVTTYLGISGDYIRIGDATTTQASLDSEDDLMVTGELEVIGKAFFGYNDNGLSAKFFGATSGAYMEWDASDDRLEFVNARESITITGTSTGKIGSTVSTAQGLAHTGWALGYFGTTVLSATTGTAGNAAGGVFEVNMASGFAATHAGIIVGAYIGAYTNAAGRRPNAGLFIEAIAGTGAT
ncbi:unnamed protein product, partial [marine sediment metagenome]